MQIAMLNLKNISPGAGGKARFDHKIFIWWNFQVVKFFTSSVPAQKV